MIIYCPMPHHKLKKHWRVPMWHVDGNYIVCVDKDYSRKFTDDTLPISIKMKLPFVKAHANYKPQIRPYYLDKWAIREPDLYICPEEMIDLENIAWQVSETFFIIVLHEKDLDSLKGEQLNKDKHDSRSKSKKQSKEDSRRLKVLSFLPSNWRIWTKWST